MNAPRPPDAAPPAPRQIRATVLFAEVLAFSALSDRVGPERAYFAVSGLLGQLDAAARHFGGSVDRYLGDALLALFRAPDTAEPTNPLLAESPEAAALATGLAMRDAALHYARFAEDAGELSLVVGINSGVVVLGDVTGPAIREFHVLGDAVNLAARIKARAPSGHVYVGGETVDVAASHFALGALGTIDVKGRAAKAKLFDLLALRTPDPVLLAACETTPWVGREAESRRLRDLAAAAQGGPTRLCVTGPPGIGRSRALRELASACRSRGLAVVCIDGRGAAADVRVLEALGAAPDTAVLVDDAHHLERRVQDALLRAAAAGEAAPALLAVSVPEPAKGFENLSLGALSADDARALLHALPATSRLSESARTSAIEKSAGVPGRLIAEAHAALPRAGLRSLAETSDRREGGERRRATILFADLTGFTSLTERLGPERAYPVVAGALEILDRIARKHDGVVEKFHGDCAMALFGVREAIEDAPRAAVNAAIEMRREIREYAASTPDAESLEIHSGIHTGLGIAGDVSGPLLREFAVMGDPVTIADALKDVAPRGSIYVGEETRRFLPDTFECRLVGDLELGRIAEPQRAYEVQNEREQLARSQTGAAQGVRAPLVGRDAELAQLSSAFAALHEGRGGVVSLVAEPGVGKSRLLSETLASEAAGGHRLIECVSLSIGRRTPFATLAELLRSAAGIDDQDAAAGALEKLDALARGFVPGDAEVAPYLARILGLELRDADRARIERLEADALENLVLRAAMLLLRGVASAGPLVLVFDDAHWADGSSITLLESLLRLANERPVLFVNVFRPGFETTSGRLLEAAREHLADRHLEIRLQPLDTDASRALLRALFVPDGLPYETRRAIEERSGGNPFYIEEVVRALLGRGAVLRVGGRFRATDRIAGFAVPGSVHEVISTRVDALALPERQVLQTASVLGDAFSRRVLESVVAERAVDAELRALVAAEFLVDSERRPGEEYAFKHPLLQEVTYESLLDTRRRELHRRVGQAIETATAESTAGRLGMLAYHFSKGGDVERAETYLFRAGDEAAQAAASSEALHFFEEASRLYLESDGGKGRDPRKQIELESKIAAALYYRGRFVEAIEHYDRALERLGDRGPRSRFGAFLRAGVDLISILARLYLPLHRRPRPASDDERQIMELRYARAEATVTAEPTQHVLNGLGTLARLQRLEPQSVPRSSRMYAGAVGLFAYGGISFPVSRRLSAVAREVAALQGEDDQLYEHVMRFASTVFEGDYAEEHEIPVERLEASLDAGQPWGPTTYLGLLGEKQVRRGDFAGTHRSMDELARIWDLFQYDLAKANFHNLEMLLPLEQRRLEAASEAAVRYYDEHPEDLLHLIALSGRAKAETLLGRLDAAEETVRQAGELLARCQPAPPFHTTTYLASALRLDLARLRTGARPGRRRMRAPLGRARAALRSAAKVAWWQPEVLRVAAACALESSSPRQRRLGWLWLERSLAVSERLGARVDLARGQALAVRAARAEPSPRRIVPDWAMGDACAERAATAFEALDLRQDLARLRRLREQELPLGR